MPIYHVQVKATLENIAHLIPRENNLWKIDVEGTAGGDKRENVTFSEDEEYEVEGGKGMANLILKLHGSQGKFSFIVIFSIVFSFSFLSNFFFSFQVRSLP